MSDQRDELRSDESGRESPCVVFVHGGKQGSWIWDEVRAAMALQAGARAPRTVALDVPGCGTKRGRSTDGVALAQVVEELSAEVDALGAGRVVLVGHSQGGLVLPRLAEAQRARVEGIVYVTCSMPLQGQRLRAMLGTGLHGAREDEIGWPLDPASHPRAVLYAAMFCNDMTPDETATFMSRLGFDDWPPACAEVDTDWRADQVADIPAAYVVALRDAMLTAEWQERFAERLHARRVSRIDGGHQLLQTRPQAVAEVLLAELRAFARG